MVTIKLYLRAHDLHVSCSDFTSMQVYQVSSSAYKHQAIYPSVNP